jgi:hypothetical protein
MVWIMVQVLMIHFAFVSVFYFLLLIAYWFETDQTSTASLGENYWIGNDRIPGMALPPEDLV